MAQEHLDRLTAIDASFLHQEAESSHMHVGARRACSRARRRRSRTSSTRSARRLHLVPRYRQKLAFPPVETGRPLWVDDPNFNLEYHVRQTALPAPGQRASSSCGSPRGSSPSSSTAPSRCGRCGSSRGWTNGRFALISKTPPRDDRRHRGRRPRARCCSTSRRCRRTSTTPTRRGSREPEPTTADLVASGSRALARTGARPRRAAPRRRCPRRRTRAADAREAAEGLGEIVWAGAEPGAADAAERRDRPAPALRRRRAASCATSSPSRTRSAAPSTTSCSPSSPARCATGCTRAACAPRASSCARSCPSRSAPRTSTARSATDRRHARPAARLRRGPGRARCASCARRWTALKESKQAVGAEVLAGVQNFAPPTILAQASRLNFSTRLFNLIVTNVPGPAVPALRPRARDARRLPGRVPAQEPRAGDRDHVLQRAR